jgi:hypothetical protein
VKESKQKPAGSILIWTVMLGVMLTSVFFFFFTQLQAGSAIQRKTIDYQNKKGYLESYVNYIQNLSEANLSGITDINLKEVVETSEGITEEITTVRGSLAKKVIALEGFLDHEESKTHIGLPNEIFELNWNACENEYRGVLLINNDQLEKPAGICAGQSYADQLQLTLADNSLTLKAVTAPLRYQIKAISGENLPDDKWHLKLSIPLNTKETIDREKTFMPKS